MIVETPLEFQPWDAIPDTHKRVTEEGREVLGRSFLDEPVWVPHMFREKA